MSHAESQGRNKEWNVQYSAEFSLDSAKTIFTNIVSNPVVKSVLALLSIAFNWLFGAEKEALLVVFSLVVLDTATGVAKGLKQKDVCSSGFFRFASKILVYLILLATASLVDKSLPLDMGAPIMYTFLAVTEAISILENVHFLGFPIPTILVKYLRSVRQPEEFESEKRGH